MRKSKLVFLVFLMTFLTVFPSLVHASGKEATIVSHTIPSTMQAGVTYPVSITVRNDGSEEWSEKDLYRLGDVNDSDPFTKGRKLIPEGQTVKPGQTITFSFDMTAPSAIKATYTTDWRMVQEGVTCSVRR
ncbi:NBR1-Ig-like domain-containing protein [Paenibacillus sp. S150]|uniref:NBR1-Ig-like domain-containing protein n=1 Tax=Paenibacillus sp. S150 TaxID=2749826 RepID=UPI001C57BDCF|nr:NBR1-Ig-like domain-containing protein [Paenibacillus sp. S150]MBW4085758.1 hypothetical protein [Paenibacillus sp. S150]